MERGYQICTRCVMDTTDPDITFNEKGHCNHCTDAIKRLNDIYFIDEKVKENRLKNIVEKIKKDGNGKKYDCIIGLSGGVDSSYLAYVVVKKLNLRPLAVHLDNGWNTELAVKNINNIVTKLGIDLYTHVLDWNEFKELQLSFLRASVIDIELLTDHAIGETIYRINNKFKIGYFLSGYNCQSETVMPTKWLYPYKMDSLNIKDIYRIHGNSLPLKTFKFLNFYEYFTFGKNQMKLIPILNNVDYIKEKAIKVLKEELDWRDYGNKHEESFFTKFYQSYILPKKFNVDKRKAHLSSLICSNQITREKALGELVLPILTNEENDISYFIKKLGLSMHEFDRIMLMPPNNHWYFNSYAKMKHKLGNLFKLLIKR
jgi:N-acetyl sugar amidotransferase